MSSDSSTPTSSKRPLFKKKLVKGNRNSRRVKLDFDDEQEPPKSEAIASKKIKSKHQFIRSTPAPQVDVSKWKVRTNTEGSSESRLEVEEGVVIDAAVEGAVLTGADLDELAPEPLVAVRPEQKYVPKLSDSIEQKLSVRTIATEMANEYKDEDDYDQIDDAHATVDPEPINDLQINEDDEMVDATYDLLRRNKEPDSAIYDVDIDFEGNSDTENTPAIRIIQPLTAGEEVDRLEKLILVMKLQYEQKITELAELQSQLPLIQHKKTDLLEKINAV